MITATSGPPASTAERSRWTLVALMCGAGVLHFVVPGPFEKIVPRWLFGSSRVWVFSSGVAELAGGFLLAAPRTRRLGGWLTAATLVAVFPANIQMAVEAGAPSDAASWLAWLRLPLQLPLIAWALRQARGGSGHPSERWRDAEGHGWRWWRHER